MSELLPLSARAVEAYGGEARWRAAKTLHCHLFANGWAFRLKLQRAVRDVLFSIDIQQPRVAMQPWGGINNRAVFDGITDEVRIESPEGNVLSKRSNPRRFFPGGRRTLRWDALDAAYFSGYASWNYTTLPRLLLRDDIEWRQPSETTLEASFPSSIPTHSAVQRFHFDTATGLLRQHDYTAEVFGGWAKAANAVLQHKACDGMLIPSRRRVTPRAGNGKPRRFPLLVGIEISDLQMTA